MVIDHIGYTFMVYGSTEYIVLRCIGRMSMPLFCFLVAEGFANTKNVTKYLQRLVLLAVLSEIPFDLFGTGHVFNWKTQNVFFTHCLGLLGLMGYEYLSVHWRKWVAVVPVIACGVAAWLLNTDYGVFGVGFIFVFYVTQDDRLYRVLITILWVAMYAVTQALSTNFIWGCITLCELLALMPILMYNNIKGYTSKLQQYSFYGFYPVHLLFLYLLVYVL